MVYITDVRINPCSVVRLKVDLERTGEGFTDGCSPVTTGGGRGKAEEGGRTTGALVLVSSGTDGPGADPVAPGSCEIVPTVGLTVVLEVVELAVDAAAPDVDEVVDELGATDVPAVGALTVEEDASVLDMAAEVVVGVLTAEEDACVLELAASAVVGTLGRTAVSVTSVPCSDETVVMIEPPKSEFVC